MSFLLNFCTCAASIIIAIYLYIKWTHRYWLRKNIPYIEPKFPFGIMRNAWTSTHFVGFIYKKIYDKFKMDGNSHGGVYSFVKPIYIPVSLEYLKNILTKDFHYFADHGMYYNEKDDPISADLFHLEGNKWKNLRAKLTPTFTTGKMKTMIPILVECSEALVQALSENYGSDKPVDIKNLLQCYTTDVVGSCAFGVDCNSCTDPNNELLQYFRKVFSSNTPLSSIKIGLAMFNHNLGRLLKIVTTPEPKDFLLNIVKNAVEHREKTGFTRKDFLQILIDLKNAPVDNETNQYGEDNSLTIEQVAAQSYLFFTAGMDTSSTTMTFVLYELAMNHDIQKRLRQEIKENFDLTTEITYDSVMNLTYLNQVVDETLRKHPPAALTARICVENYRIPRTNITIDKGTRVIIPIYALHHDPDYFPNPAKFDPERFSDVNRPKVIPFTYMPFGEGPRICIGSRFGLMQVKVGLVALLRNFKFTVNPKTNDPIVFEPFSQTLSVQGGIWLDVEHAL